MQLSAGHAACHGRQCDNDSRKQYKHVCITTKAQIPLGSSRLDTTRHVRRVASRDERVEPCCSNMAVDEEASARLYKFSRFYALTYTNPMCSVK